MTSSENRSIPASAGRQARLSARVRKLFADATGFEIALADGDTPFIELGMDSLTLTQVSVQLGKVFPVGITFRQLMEDCASVDRLVSALDARLPPEPPPDYQLDEAGSAPLQSSLPKAASAALPSTAPADTDTVRFLVARQTQLMTRHLTLLSQCTGVPAQK